MKINQYLSIIIVVICCCFACAKLDVAPMNVVQDKDLFKNSAGVKIYMARLYSGLPIEDFRYSPARGLNHFWIIEPFSCTTGEAISRDAGGSTSERDDKYWKEAFKLIRETNYFLETLPIYESNFTAQELDHFIGEALFIRAFTYYALAKRYGGVPIIQKVLNYPGQSISELKILRSAEEKVWDFIAADLDIAIERMRSASEVGRANKYVAAALKSRAMLHAGSIAKYNQTSFFDNNQIRLCGIPSARAKDYFKASYNASLLLENKYELYDNDWKPNDKFAQYQNFLAIFTNKASRENIFVRQYLYPSSVHGYDCYYVPRQLMGPNGYSSAICPTLNFVEMFDGLPKNANGTIKTLDANGNYMLFDETMDFFKDAEPRLRATVIFPNDEFKGQQIEIWRGIFTGEIGTGIKPIHDGSAEQYPKGIFIESNNQDQQLHTLPNGKTMYPAGKSGIFSSGGACALSGFTIRKLLNESTPTSLVMENRADQTWIEMRYAEVLLNRAEAAFELNLSGETGNYKDDAFECINQIRARAGANLLTNVSELNNIDIVRKERRKELSFENKIWWDLKRWRIIDQEQRSTYYRSLMPFFAEKANKWFFDARLDEFKKQYTFDTRWYYQEIPNEELTTGGILQNPGY